MYHRWNNKYNKKHIAVAEIADRTALEIFGAKIAHKQYNVIMHVRHVFHVTYAFFFIQHSSLE